MKKEKIAIVGMSGLFAGSVSIRGLWKNICEEIDSIIPVPPSRWSIDDYYDPNPYSPDKTYSRVGGFIPEIDFDPMEFGLPPNILEVTDSSQLLGLAMAKEALIDAGYWNNEKFSKPLRERTAVILGAGGGQKLITPLTSRLQYPVWRRAMIQAGMSASDADRIVSNIKNQFVGWEENSFPGSLSNVIAGRITNRLDLGGTNCVVDAACAASLSAIKMALSELYEGRADMVISGGVDTDNSPGMYMSFSKTPAFSLKNKIRPFDADADGMVVGEGVGMLIFKRLSDAEKDGDRIYATVTGIGSSSDGKNKSIYAPQSSGQALAMRRCYEDAGYAPSTVGLLECHGTGTPAGDLSELNSMLTVFGDNNPAKQSIAIGSIKSQIGHTKAAAGAVGMMKSALALYHKILPPTINVSEPNRGFDIDETPLYINTSVRPWIKPKHTPRRASVSAFGFGGTNFHIALEEHEGEHKSPYRLDTGGHIVLLGAADKTTLTSDCENLIRSLETDRSEEVFIRITDNSNDVNFGKKESKLGFVCQDATEALSKLKKCLDHLKSGNDEDYNELPGGIVISKGLISGTQKVAALFSGQGSQYPNMAKHMACASPVFRETLQKMNDVFDKSNSKLSDIIFPVPVFTPAKEEQQKERLKQTQHAQPAIGVISAAFYKLLKQSGFEADMFAGHSFGELSALWAAGVINEDDFFELAKARGEAMSAEKNPGQDAGAMLAVMSDLESFKTHLASFPEVQVANINAPRQIVLGGSLGQLNSLKSLIESSGIDCVMLPVSAAFHTPFVAHAAKPFAAKLTKIKLLKSKLPVYSNSLGTKYPQQTTEIKIILNEHILKPVLFQKQVETMYNDGARIFVEIGPKSVLCGLTKKILEGKPHITIAVNPGGEKNSELQFLEAIVKMKVAGVDISLPEMYTLPAAASSADLSKMNVRISAANVVSEKSMALRQAAAEDDFKIAGNVIQNSLPAPIISPPAATNNDLIDVQIEGFAKMLELMQTQLGHLQKAKGHTPQQVQNVPATFSLETKVIIPVQVNNTMAIDLKQLSEALLNVVSEKTGYPSSMLEMTMDMEADLGIDSIKRVEIFGAMQEKYPDLTGANPAEMAALNTLEQVVNYIESKLARHSTYSEPQDLSEKTADLTPAPEIEVNNISPSEMTNALLEVVSEKTGYPSSMLEMDMDMEADLGIDSIKRVEIFGAMQEKYPNLTGANPAEMAALNTLAQVVNYIGAKLSGEVENKLISPIEKTEMLLNTGDMQNVLLEVVSEKTGYPSDMLEMDMDMEADLGIDSIKRVEIFGAMQEKYPNLTGANPQEMAELRTLGQVLEYVSAKIANVGSPEPLIIVEQNPASVAGENKLDLNLLSSLMLEVVSEKTGYPSDMLEMDMDMEADLGIDSIKRVEIFGAMQEKYPNLTGANPQEMAELRTLGQVATYIGDRLTGGTNNGVSALNHLPKPAENEAKVFRYEPQLRYIPLPDFMEQDWNKDDIFILTDDGSDLTISLLKKLSEIEVNIRLLQFPANIVTTKNARKLPKGVNITPISKGDDEEIKNLIHKISNEGNIKGFIHLHPKSVSESLTESAVNEGQIIKAVFFFAKHLEASLNKRTGTARSFFISSFRLDGALGLNNRSNFGVNAGAQAGLIKTLNYEWEPVFCRAVDIHPAIDAKKAADILFAEIHDPNRKIQEVAYDGKQRTTIVPVRTDAISQTLENSTVRSNDVFLVSGGARGITAACIIRLAELYKPKFILLGRTDISKKEPEWAIGINDTADLKKVIFEKLSEGGKKVLPKEVQQLFNQITAQREIEVTLAALKNAGSKVEYVNADVTDIQLIKKRLPAAIKKLGAITGIIHGAGKLADKSISQKTEADYESVISVKTGGLLNMLDLVDEKELRHLLLFSSVAGFYGNAGQADYAMANEVLNKTAWFMQKRNPKCRVVSYNWGPWDGGMVTPELKKLFEERNVATIPIDFGTFIFANELSNLYSNNTQVIIGSALPSFPGPMDKELKEYQIHRHLTPAQSPFVNDHVIAGYAVLPIVNGIVWMADVCVQLYPGFKASSCENTKLYKGIVFDQNHQKDYKLNIREISKSTEELVFDAKISSIGKGGKTVFHYAATIHLTKDSPAELIFKKELSHVPLVNRPGEELYFEKTLFHGPMFQGVKEVLRMDDKHLLLRCELGHIDHKAQGQFPVINVNTFLADIQYQGMVIWARKVYDAVGLPVSSVRAGMHAFMDFDKEYFVLVEVKEHSSFKMIADVTTFDKNGKVYFVTKRAEVALSQELKQAFLVEQIELGSN